VPASSLTMARRVFVSRLNKVDLPTFGRPTIATKLAMIYFFLFAKVRKKTKNEE
jgi:hypothetical protein